MAIFNLNINGKKQQVDVDPATPMLWVLRDHLDLTGTKYGCGIAACGACTIHLGDVAMRSCQLPVSAVGNQSITTIEGLSVNKPVVEKVYATVDCGVVVNPDAAANMGEGVIVDGIGNALYGEMTFKDGVPQKNNFNTYRMIRHSEAPKSIEVHFVKSEADPTGLGEPLFPPIFAALANALYKARGKREYNQPFLSAKQV